ncbi:hypothetical protein [Novosphingobium sp.]
MTIPHHATAVITGASTVSAPSMPTGWPGAGTIWSSSRAMLPA